jgi:hypothetical protein
LRRSALMAARSLPSGPERHQRRQIAASLRNLMKNDGWLDAYVKSGSRIRIEKLNGLKSAASDRRFTFDGGAGGIASSNLGGR